MLALLQLVPLQDAAKLVQSPKDIYELRSTLKYAQYSENIVRHLAQILVNAVDSGARFRQFDCLKVLRAIVKDQTEPQLSPETTSLLFRLYKHYIFHHREEVRWCVSEILRGRVLAELELDWLLMRWEQSLHFVNRLLRYPIYDPKLADWATQVNGHELLANRHSEVIALAIKDCLPEFAELYSNDAVIWAIFYAQVPDRMKEKMLISSFSFDSLESYIEVSLRLESRVALHFALEQCDSY